MGRCPHWTVRRSATCSGPVITGSSTTGGPPRWESRHGRTRLAGTTPADDDPDAWRAREAFNQYKGACANLTALALFRSGAVTAPNLLAIGTAVPARFLRRPADLVE